MIFWNILSSKSARKTILVSFFFVIFVRNFWKQKINFDKIWPNFANFHQLSLTLSKIWILILKIMFILNIGKFFFHFCRLAPRKFSEIQFFCFKKQFLTQNYLFSTKISFESLFFKSFVAFKVHTSMIFKILEKKKFKYNDFYLKIYENRRVFK